METNVSENKNCIAGAADKDRNSISDLQKRICKIEEELAGLKAGIRTCGEYETAEIVTRNNRLLNAGEAIENAIRDSTGDESYLLEEENLRLIIKIIRRARSQIENGKCEPFKGAGRTNTGRKIMRIRTEKGISRSRLGEMVGLDVNRIQQYENGIRKPKSSLCEKIAEALNVSTNSLTDPQVNDPVGAMYAFFEMEEYLGLKLKLSSDGKVNIYFQEGQSDTTAAGTINRYLKKWYGRKDEMEQGIAWLLSDEEEKNAKLSYDMWKWNF